MEIDNNTITITYDKEKNLCRLISSRYSLLTPIISQFTTENTASFFVEQYGYNVPNQVTVINSLGYFRVGLFTQVYKALKELYPQDMICIANKEQLLDKAFPLRGILDTTNILNISDKINLRPYQEEAIRSVLKYGRGLIECPTASGKSFIIGNIIYNLMSSRLSSMFNYALIYVPTRQLVDQFYSDLLDYGFTKDEVCKFSTNTGKKRDKTFEDNSCSNGFKKIIITNRDFIRTKLDKLPTINVLICDEVHTVTPDSGSARIIESFKTDIKVGFSGSIPIQDYNKWTLIGLFGSILFRESITNLQDQGFLAPLKIISIDVFDQHVNDDTNLLFSLKTHRKFDKEDMSEDALKFNDAYNDETDYITKNLYRLYKKPLEHICNDEENKNILILFDRTEFGVNIYEEAKNTILNKEIFFIDGSIDIDTRENIRKVFEEKNGGIVFAQSKTFSTGINIKNLDCIAFFFSGKGFSKILQSIGRTLRLHKNKTHAKLYDISFNYKYSQKHKKERFDIYNDCYNKHKYDKVINIRI